MQIKCSVITDKTKEIASKIGKSNAVTQNIINTWRTWYGNDENEYPTMEEIQEYLNADIEQKKDIFLSVPCYEFKGYDPKSTIINRDGNGNITLMQFPNNSLGYFWNKIGDRQDLRPYITSTDDAYRWLLWKEMSYIQNGFEKTPENEKIAEAEATAKAKKWKAYYPDYNSGHTLADIVLSKFGGYFEGGGSIIENDYPNLPANLITKVENICMGGSIANSPLTEKEALEFLQHSDPSLIPAGIQDTLARQQIAQKNASNSGESTVVVTGSAKTTAYTAVKTGGIDTLRHPGKDGMHFGNPFTHMNGVQRTIKVATVKEAAEAYDAWLRGDEYYKGIKLSLVDPERREWIVKQILDGSLKGKKLIYYTDVVPDSSYSAEHYNPETAPNHAHILADYINGKRQVINSDVSSQRKTGIQAVDEAMEAVDTYTKWQKKHITFDKKHHKYYHNGNPIDNTVTEYGERIFGKPNIQGDYKFTQEMGNDVDGFTRDYYLQRFDLTVDPMKSIFPNLTDARKQELLKSEQRLESYLKQLYGDNCKIITRDLMLAGKIKTNQGDETIAGTIDMMVIDEQGNVHLLDMKTKGHSIDKVVRGKVVDDRRNYTFQLNAYKQLIEVCMPELAGKIKDLTLIWFDNVYPKQVVTIDGTTYGETKYTTNNETGEVTVSDRETPSQPLKLYYKWHTPSLKADIKESLIPLDINQEPLQQVRPIVNPAQINTASTEASAVATEQPSTNKEKTVYRGTSKKGAVISKRGYLKGDPQNHPNVDFTFTENAEAFCYVNGINAQKEYGVVFPFKGTPKINVSDIHGTNQAGIRTDSKGNVSPNVHGIIVKKFQQNSEGYFVKGPGQFQDTENDFNMFKSLNEISFDKLEKSPNEEIVFPQKLAMGKAALPERFIDWLQAQLKERYGLDYKKKRNPTPGYSGYGLEIAIAAQKNTPQIPDYLENFNIPDADLPDDIREQITGIPNTDNTEAQPIQSGYNTPEISVNAVNKDTASELAKLALDFTRLQLYDRAENMARMFSEKVTTRLNELIDENAKELAEEMNNDNPDISNINRLYERAKLLNDADKGRKFAIEDLTLKAIFDEMRQEYEENAEVTAEEWEEEYGRGKGEYMANAYQKIVEHFDEILKDACNLIEGRENIRIILDKKEYSKDGLNNEEALTGTLAPTEQDLQDEDDEFGDDDEGKRVEGNEGWSYKVRFIDPVTSMSKDVKNVLYGLLKFDLSGEPETDDLGNPRYINGEYVHAVLVNDLSKMVTPDDFSYTDEDGEVRFPALEKLQNKYPWVNQIIVALKSNPRLVSAFYADLRKDFIPTWIQREVIERDANGRAISRRYETVPVNRPVAREGTKNAILDNYEQGTVLDVDSLYDSGRIINKDNAKKGKDITKDVDTLLRDFDTDYIDEQEFVDMVANAAKAFRMLGTDINSNAIRNLLKSDGGKDSLSKAINAAGRIFDGVLAEEYKDDSHLINEFNSDYNIIASEIGLVSELNNISSFRIGDDTYYSYSAPNYMDTMFKSLMDDSKRDVYIENQFSPYRWFRDQKTKEWHSEWIRLIADDSEEGQDVRDHMEMKELKALPDTDKNELVQYKDWSPIQIRQGFIREYFSAGYNEKSLHQYAWYNFPIFSDSPVAKFIKFKRYVNTKEKTFEQQLLPLFLQVAKQELERIRLVQDRRKAGVRQISNFDKKGDEFKFFPELNQYRKEIDRFTEVEDTEGLDKYLTQRINEIITDLYKEFRSSPGVDAMIDYLKSDGIATTNTEAENALREYFWNQAYATTQIIELCTTDLAFYKNATDFQKRFKEVYAAGTKLNTNSDYGKKIERTLYLADQIVTSSSYQDIRKSLNNAVAGNRIKSYDRDNILNKFKDINATDAQAYRNLPSMRSLLDMIGKWDDNMENAFNRFESGEWNMADFNLIWQTIKPFVYTQIGKPDGLGGRMKVPHQNKNSEFLLLAFYSLVAGSERKSPKLRALDRFMRDNDIDVIQFESAVKAGGQGIIDISYSESKLNDWVKENDESWREVLQATKDALKIPDEKLEEMSYHKIFKEGNDYLLDNDKITQEEYNKRFEAIEPDEQEVYDILNEHSKDENGEFLEEVIHEIPYEDYCIQQPTPEHLVDHQAVFGSQFRNLIIADMPDDPNFRVTVNGKEYTKEEIIHLYNSLIVENLLEDWKKLSGKFETIEKFQKALEDTIKGNPKYGRDMLNAIQLVDDSETGEKTFNIPLDNPSTTLKLQEVITSMFKNAITKQHIKGGACILVSDFGLTKELNLLHDPETGAVTGIECYLPAYSKEFFEPLMVEKKDENGRTYKELDIEKLPMSMRKAIGYRIPTEDKYSMAPLIIKGFLPQQNGSSIMLPADITQIAGSDFDVDKMFLMLPEFRVDTYDKARARNDYERIKEIEKQFIPVLNAMELGGGKVNELIADKEQELGYTRDNLIADTEKLDKGIELPDETLDKMDALKKFIQETEESQGYSQYDDKGARAIREQVREEDIEDPSFKAWFDSLSEDEKEKYKYDTPKIRKRKYDINKTPQEQKRAERNNMIIDIAYGILTNPHTAESIHNPGSFDTAKIAARVAKITGDPALLSTFAVTMGIVDTFGEPDLVKAGHELLAIQRKGDLDTLDNFLKDHTKERSQLTIETFVYNHYQNMTGGALIGMYANNTSMQAKYQRTKLAVKDDFVFTINGYKMKSLHDIFSERGERISKNCANFSAASVDNVKDPVLADLMQNKNTANIAGTMLRLGMSIEEIGLLFTQPAIKEFIQITGGLDASAFSSFIEEQISALQKAGGGIDTNIKSKNFTSEELMDNITKQYELYSLPQNEALKTWANQIQAMLLMHNIIKISDDLSELTRISRADSPNGAIDISIAGAKMQVHRISRFVNKARTATKYRPFTLIGIEEGVKNGYVDSNMGIDELREKFLSTKLPMLQAFYSLGIEFGNKLLSKYFSQSCPKTDAMVDMLFDMSNSGILQENLLNSFYSELVIFELSKTPLFGDDPKGIYDKNHTTYEEKRDYYLYDFVREYQKILADNPDIANMSIFKRMQVVEGTIIMKRSGKITSYMREALMRDFDMLLYMDNPVATKLAIGLFMYSYYKDGFKFGPFSFGNFFSTAYVTAFPEFINTLRNLRKNTERSYFNEFLPQFIANHWNEEKFLPEIENKTDNFGRDSIIELNDGTGRIAINSKYVRNYNIDHNNLKPGYKHSKPYIIYVREVTSKNPDTGKKEINIVRSLYALIDEGTNSSIYAPAAMFDRGTKKAVRYNANSTALKMNEIKTDAKRIEANSKINPKRKGYFNIDAYLNSLGDIDARLEQIEGIGASIDFDNIDDKLSGIDGLNEEMLDKISELEDKLGDLPEEAFEALDNIPDYAFDDMPDIPDMPDINTGNYLDTFDQRYLPEDGESQLDEPLCKK